MWKLIKLEWKKHRIGKYISNACYLVFSSVMLATFLVGAYREKMVNVMFTYPIPRKKLMAVGMLFKSGKATVIMSFLLFFLLNGTIGDFSLADHAFFPILLALLSLACAAICCLGIEKRDVN